MTDAGGESDFLARLARVEALVGRLERAEDPALRDAAKELLRSVLELHARGLSRLLELTQGGAELATAASDPALGALLALHGLHPTPLHERSRRALDDIADKLGRSGGRAELLSADAACVRARLFGPASLATLVEETLAAAAPDASEIAVEVLAPLVSLRRGREASQALGGKE